MKQHIAVMLEIFGSGRGKHLEFMLHNSNPKVVMPASMSTHWMLAGVAEVVFCVVFCGSVTFQTDSTSLGCLICMSAGQLTFNPQKYRTQMSELDHKRLSI
jgi:hypothetical protein